MQAMNVLTTREENFNNENNIDRHTLQSKSKHPNEVAIKQYSVWDSWGFGLRRWLHRSVHA